MFVQIKRGGTLETEWIICKAELVSEVTLTLVYTHFGYKEGFLCFSMLVIRTQPEQLGVLCTSLRLFQTAELQIGSINLDKSTVSYDFPTERRSPSLFSKQTCD